MAMMAPELETETLPQQIFVVPELILQTRPVTVAEALERTASLRRGQVLEAIRSSLAQREQEPEEMREFRRWQTQRSVAQLEMETGGHPEEHGQMAWRAYNTAFQITHNQGLAHAYQEATVKVAPLLFKAQRTVQQLVNTPEGAPMIPLNPPEAKVSKTPGRARIDLALDVVSRTAMGLAASHLLYETMQIAGSHEGDWRIGAIFFLAGFAAKSYPRIERVAKVIPKFSMNNIKVAIKSGLRNVGPWSSIALADQLVRTAFGIPNDPGNLLWQLPLEMTMIRTLTGKGLNALGINKSLEGTALWWNNRKDVANEFMEYLHFQDVDPARAMSLLRREKSRPAASKVDQPQWTGLKGAGEYLKGKVRSSKTHGENLLSRQKGWRQIVDFLASETTDKATALEAVNRLENVIEVLSMARVHNLQTYSLLVRGKEKIDTQKMLEKLYGLERQILHKIIDSNLPAGDQNEIIANLQRRIVNGRTMSQEEALQAHKDRIQQEIAHLYKRTAYGWAVLPAAGVLLKSLEVSMGLFEQYAPVIGPGVADAGKMVEYIFFGVRHFNHPSQTLAAELLTELASPEAIGTNADHLATRTEQLQKLAVFLNQANLNGEVRTSLLNSAGVTPEQVNQFTSWLQKDNLSLSDLAAVFQIVDQRGIDDPFLQKLMSGMQQHPDQSSLENFMRVVSSTSPEEFKKELARVITEHNLAGSSLWSETGPNGEGLLERLGIDRKTIVDVEQLTALGYKPAQIKAFLENPDPVIVDPSHVVRTVIVQNAQEMKALGQSVVEGEDWPITVNFYDHPPVVIAKGLGLVRITTNSEATTRWMQVAKILNDPSQVDFNANADHPLTSPLPAIFTGLSGDKRAKAIQRAILLKGSEFGDQPGYGAFTVEEFLAMTGRNPTSAEGLSTVGTSFADVLRGSAQPEDVLNIAFFPTVTVDQSGSFLAHVPNVVRSVLPSYSPGVYQMVSDFEGNWEQISTPEKLMLRLLQYHGAAGASAPPLQVIQMWSRVGTGGLNEFGVVPGQIYHPEKYSPEYAKELLFGIFNVPDAPVRQDFPTLLLEMANLVDRLAGRHDINDFCEKLEGWRVAKAIVDSGKGAGLEKAWLDNVYYGEVDGQPIRGVDAIFKVVFPGQSINNSTLEQRAIIAGIQRMPVHQDASGAWFLNDPDNTIVDMHNWDDIKADLIRRGRLSIMRFVAKGTIPKDQQEEYMAKVNALADSIKWSKPPGY